MQEAGYMDASLRQERIEVAAEALKRGGYWEKTLLPQEIQGVTARYAAVGAGKEHTVEPRSSQSRVMLFVRGTGAVSCVDRWLPIEEIAVFCPPPTAVCVVRARKPNLQYLEILTELTPAESERLQAPGSGLPHFLRYSECSQYGEAIKSKKTVSRTLLAADLIPRLAIGSVQTTGPDRVDAHRHPMLEQLFFGLPGNRCYVRADEEEIVLADDTLLHIPLGSNHCVRVEEGSLLHYLWLDFFRSEQDMSYIAETHRPIGRNHEPK
jgi:mannose-6-phosphate isomerase-like protein (cupin superfamily)